MVEIDQQAAPIDRVLDGHGWADLGVLKVDTTGSENLEVTLSGLAGEQVAADAVRVIKVGPSAKKTFDGLGQLIAETDALGRTTSYEYDSAGFQTKVTMPDPDGAGPLAASYIERQFDVLGNITSQTNNLGETTSYQYDQLYRVIKQTDPNAAETLYTYDLQGNLLSLSDPVGNVTSYTYDDLNRLVLEEITVDSQTLSRSTEYDLTGAVTRQVDRQGRVRDFTYDALHRRLSETWYANVADADSQANPLNDIDTTYDAVDRLMAITDDFSDYAYTYDQLDRLLTTTASHPGLPEVTLTGGYTRKDNLRTSLAAEIDSVDDFFNEYEYDDLGRLTRIDQSAQTGGNAVAEKRVDLSYNLDHTFASITRYADLAATDLVATSVFTYDDSARLTSLSHAKGANTLASYTWAYDESNRVTTFTSATDGDVDYTYDDRGQLTAADYDYQTDESYTYDDNGNRTLSGGQTVTTGDHNRLASDGGYSYQFDSQGNRTRRTNSTTGAVEVYSWDARNRLVSVTNYANATDADAQQNELQVVEYTYDVYNRRIGKTVDSDGNGTIDSREAYIWDGGNVVLDFADLDADGQIEGDELTARYLWGPQTDQLLAVEQPDSLTTADPADVLWTLSDNLGSVRDAVTYLAATDATTVAEHYVYDAFGNITAVTDGGGTPLSAASLRHLYTAQEWDDDIGLHYYDNRWYDSASGLFLSADPIEDDQNNTYRYVGNSPTNATDPTGLWTIGAGHNGGLVLIVENELDVREGLRGLIKGVGATDEFNLSILQTLNPGVDLDNLHGV